MNGVIHMHCFDMKTDSIPMWKCFRSSNPKKRYELFLKATQLDVIIEKLNACLQQTNAAKAKYMTQKRKYLNMQEIQKKAHDKLNQFKSMEPLKVCKFHILIVLIGLHLSFVYTRILL